MRAGPQIWRWSRALASSLSGRPAAARGPAVGVMRPQESGTRRRHQAQTLIDMTGE